MEIFKFFISSKQKRINFDKNLLKRFYLNNGYYDVQITSSDINFVGNNLANITFSINSGQRIFFFKIVIKDDEKNLNEENIKDLNKIISKKLKGNFSQKNLMISIILLMNIYVIRKLNLLLFLIKLTR